MIGGRGWLVRGRVRWSHPEKPIGFYGCSSAGDLLALCMLFVRHGHIEGSWAPCLSLDDVLNSGLLVVLCCSNAVYQQFRCCHGDVFFVCLCVAEIVSTGAVGSGGVTFQFERKGILWSHVQRWYVSMRCIFCYSLLYLYLLDVQLIHPFPRLYILWPHSLV